MKILVFVKDLFFRVKIESELKRLNLDYQFLENLDKLGEFDFLVLDLEQEKNFEAVQKLPEKVICFCSHKNIEVIRRAKDAGCKNVYPRSVFFEKLEKIVT